MKKNLLLLLICCATVLQSNAQNCANTSVGYPPVRDLGTGYWRGFQGGLYPNGSNYRPAAHNLAGLNIAQNIMPLDTNGNVDMNNGKVVWLSVGMSNTTFETQFFIPMADTFSQKNPKLILIDGAQGGQDITIINNPNANFWNIINQRLASAGLTYKQVQAIWFKQAQIAPTDTAFATYPDSLKIKFKTALQIEKIKFPNTKLAYLSNRIYAGYATTALNPEPYAYYSGWSVKRLVEDQINGDTSLIYTGANPRVPWLAWGPDLWADGTTPRSDGLTWVCPADFNPDGTHPSSPYGRQKVANLLFNFFTTDSTSVPWFLIPNSTGIQNNETAFFSALKIYPDPAATDFTIELPGKNFDIAIADITGRKFLEKKNVFAHIQINSKNYPEGIYFIQLLSENKIEMQKIVIQH
jgi:type IX secretion system substrate protein